jgi:hypothetical protein
MEPNVITYSCQGKKVIQVCGLHMKRPSAALFGFEILAGKQIHFLAIRYEREKDQFSDQQD